MTILEKISLGKEAYLNINEAPCHLTTSTQRQKWIQRNIPCFNKDIFKFWKIYSTPLSEEEYFELPMEMEQDERRRFIRYPIATLSLKDEALGGAWIDEIRIVERDKKMAHLHIKILREGRSFAYPLFDTLLNSMKRKYDYLYTAWGKRNIEDDPTKFLRNNGFQITKNIRGGEAILKI